MSKNLLLKNKNKTTKMSNPTNQQPKQITRPEFDKMLNDMTPQQALQNMEALVKHCLGNGLFKEPAEILAADRAIVVLNTVIQSHIALEKKVVELEKKTFDLQKPPILEEKSASNELKAVPATNGLSKGISAESESADCQKEQVN